MAATPAWPPRSAPRLFVSPALAQGEQRVIDGPQAHYLARVMRVAVGDAVILCDDATGEWATRVVAAGKRDVTVEVVERTRAREDVPDFTLCAALLKKPRFDQVLEKATELGVAKIRPVVTRRCVADALNLERTRTVVAEAAEQCARTALPEVFEPVPLARVVVADFGRADRPERLRGGLVGAGAQGRDERQGDAGGGDRSLHDWFPMSLDLESVSNTCQPPPSAL